MSVLIAEEPFVNGEAREFAIHPDRVRAHLMIIASASLTDFDDSFGDEPVDQDMDGVREWSRVLYDPGMVDAATGAGSVKAALKELVDDASAVEIYGVDWTWVVSRGGDTSTATPGIQLGNTVIYDTSQANGEGRWMRDTEDDKKCVLDAEILYHELSHVRLDHGLGDPAQEEREARIEEAKLQRALGRPARSADNGEAGVGCEGEGPCCIVATVASGGPYAPTVARLRAVRDRALRGTPAAAYVVASQYLDYVDLRPLKLELLAHDLDISRAQASRALALLVAGGSVVAASTRGERTIAADDFFVTHFTTALAADELVLETRWPRTGAAAFEELAQRAGDYALAMAACTLRREDGAVAEARIGLGSVVDRPTLVTAAAAVLEGRPVDGEAAREAGEAAAEHAQPYGGLHASAAYQRHLVRVLVSRAVLSAWR